MVTAQVCEDPRAIVLNDTLAGMVTATGNKLCNVVPLPSRPWALLPQQYAVPIVVKAQMCALLASIALNNTPAGLVTSTGTLLFVVVPLPS